MGTTVDDLLRAWADKLPSDAPWSRSQVLCLVILDTRLPNILNDHGLTLRGFSWKEGVPYGLLTVRVTKNDEPLVAFISERLPSKCIEILLRKLAADELELKRDKFFKVAQRAV